jgi:hypothetical protein
MFGEPPQTVDSPPLEVGRRGPCGARVPERLRLEGARRACGMHRSMAIGRKSGGSTQIYETKPILHALQ